MRIRNIRLSNVTITNRPVVGESVFTTTGTYNWVCPPEVYSVSVVCIGPGAVVNDDAAIGNDVGAGGGALAWRNNIPVKPGNAYIVYNGTFQYLYNGPGSSTMQPGSAFRIENYANGGARYALAAGGADVKQNPPGSYTGYYSNFFTGEGGGLGGQSTPQGNPSTDVYSSLPNSNGWAGAGGAGGYVSYDMGGYGISGGHGGHYGLDAEDFFGANLGYGQPGYGGGGGGAGTGISPTYSNGPAPIQSVVAFGGGTGLYGQGESGEGGIGAAPGEIMRTGSAGSGGYGHLYGGGVRVPNAYGITDSPGAVRIIWPGAIRKFPNTNTGEAGVVYSYNTNQ